MANRELFRMRSYQRELRDARLSGYTRFLCLWHRRAGKDRNALFFTLESMLTRVGVYFHIFPSLNQGRRDLWDNVIQEVGADGIERSMKMTDMFPPELIRRRDQTEMQIELANGSLYQIMGADSDEAVSRLRGPNPIGLIFSEYAHGDKMPAAWDTLSPVLAENNGWALFVYTPNGINHGKTLYEMAIKNKDWFVSTKSVDDTRRDGAGENGAPVVSLARIEKEKAEGKRPEFIAQEYYCKFTGFQHGTIYGDLMIKADEDGRIARVPYVNHHPVGVMFDLGHSDAMACWFYQRFGNNVNFIDYWQATQKDMHDWVRVAREHKPYVYGRVILPWDGRGQAEYLASVYFRNIAVCKRSPSVQADIEEIRRQFPRFYFDEMRCADGLSALRNYKRKFDENINAFAKVPIHDQYSHGADALRTGVMGGLDPLEFIHGANQPLRVETQFDPREIR